MERARKATIISAAATVLALVGAACTSGGGGGGGAAAPPDETEAARVVALSDFAISPADLEVPAGVPLAISVTNEGQAPHTFALSVGDDVYDSGQILAGASATLSVPALDAGAYETHCSIPGHTDLGMVGTLTASAEATPETSASPGAHTAEAHGLSAEEMAAMHEEGVNAFLEGGQTETHGNQPLDFTTDGPVKVFELTASRVQWETSKGVVVDAMAYNGTVPGPEIRVQPGDRVRVVLQNQMDQPTALHFHGLTVPNEADGVPYVTQPPIMPGEYWVYDFRVVDPPGMYVYHSHFNSTEQVGSGLYGALIVEPRKGWRSVYGVTPDVETDVFLGDGPLDYTLNGKSFPATLPIVASAGDDVLIHMANDGSQLHPMHLHGFHFTVVGVDGFPLENPYDADTIVVAPGSRYDILVKADQPGAWAFHCHILSHVEGPEGMYGMVTALVVQ
jgi:FtsP/CotA-like multicopper oxidase with cupredoxin domain